MRLQDVEDHKNLLFIRIPKNKTNVQRSFTVTDKFYPIVKEYLNIRSEINTSDRFFLTYRKGKCTQQPVGINTFGKMPKIIAEYLQLPNPEGYTGHSFRRTSTTLLADAGADLLEIKRHGAWKSNTTAEGYIDASKNNKIQTANKIASNFTMKPSVPLLTTSNNTASTSVKSSPVLNTVKCAPSRSVNQDVSNQISTPEESPYLQNFSQIAHYGSQHKDSLSFQDDYDEPLTPIKSPNVLQKENLNQVTASTSKAPIDSTLPSFNHDYDQSSNNKQTKPQTSSACKILHQSQKSSSNGAEENEEDSHPDQENIGNHNKRAKKALKSNSKKRKMSFTFNNCSVTIKIFNSDQDIDFDS